MDPDPLQQQLQQALCHVTSPDGFKGIRASGAILPNDGTRPLSCPQSQNSYATAKSAVALFDFERTDAQWMNDHWWKCVVPFLHRYLPATYVLLLDRAQLSVPLITYTEAMAEVGYTSVMIQHMEAWSPQPVPWSAITGVMVVVFREWVCTLDPSDPQLDDPASLIAAKRPDLLQQEPDWD
jgi:hypothetical protein